MRHPRQQSRQSVDRARELRQASTRGEQLLWQILRNRSLEAKFRRHHPLGPYVLDFYCPQLKLAIELDGAVHDSSAAKAYDDYRESRLRRLGVTMLRIRTEQVVANPKLVTAQVEREIEDLRSLAEQRRQ